MTPTGPIQPDTSFAIQPPKSKEALFHQGMSAASLINELTEILNNQIGAIERDDYNIKITTWLQGALKEFTTAIAEMQKNAWPQGVNDLLKALKTLNELHGMSAKQLGGPFGTKMGEGIKKQITAIYDGVSNSLGGLLSNSYFPGGAKLLQDYLANPSKPIPEKDLVLIQVAINKEIQRGLTPLQGLSQAINEQVSSLDAMSALAIANFGRGKNNGVNALQAMGKTTSQFWKILIQMISSIQSGG